MKLTRQFVRDGEPVAVSAEHVGGDRWRVRVGERLFEVDALAVDDGGVRVVPCGDTTGRAFVAYGAPAGKVRAPMTGTVLDVLCKVGDTVAANQPIVVLSAMKMEHKLTAGVAGVVTKVDAQKGGTVEQGALLAVVEPAKEMQQ